MKANTDLREYFAPILGERPWRARHGWGSFLTFDFGRRVRVNSHFRGEWHLWIYQCEWELRIRDRVIVHSESSRRLIDVAVRQLEKEQLTAMEFKREGEVSTFKFSRAILTC